MAKYSNASFLISIVFGLAACVPASHRTAQDTEPRTEATLRLASLSNPGNPFELNKGVRKDDGDPFEIPLRDTCRPLVGPDGKQGGWVCPEEEILRVLGPLGGQWKAMADSTTSAGCWISCAGNNGKKRNERSSSIYSEVPAIAAPVRELMLPSFLAVFEEASSSDKSNLLICGPHGHFGSLCVLAHGPKRFGSRLLS